MYVLYFSLSLAQKALTLILKKKIDRKSKIYILVIERVKSFIIIDYSLKKGDKKLHKIKIS